jgi:hypothetical protein
MTAGRCVLCGARHRTPEAGDLCRECIEHERRRIDAKRAHPDARAVCMRCGDVYPIGLPRCPACADKAEARKAREALNRRPSLPAALGQVVVVDLAAWKERKR